MSDGQWTLECAPAGLLQTTDGVLILKTEYRNENGAIDAYIVKSGEYFWGDQPQTPERQRNQVVHVLPTAGIRDTATEVIRAVQNWPPFNSAHEAYAVLAEEVDELWQHVKTNQKKRDLVAMRAEAIQVAAMALRFATEVCNEERGRK